MSKCKHLIIGCGPAALAAARAIRSLRAADEIKLVSREDCLPYSPAALPYLFSGEVKESAFFAKGADCLKEIDAKLLTGKEVEELIPEAREVKYGDGKREGFDKLLIATGSQPWVPPIAGLEKVPYYTLRKYSDYKKISEGLRGKRTIAIYGGGLVAVEMAEKMTLTGHSVTMIVRSSLLRRYLTPQISKTVRDVLTKHGVRVRTESALQEVRKNRGRLVFSFADGEPVLADLFLIATGVDPNRLGSPFLQVAAGGLRAGRHLETNLPDVYVAGDVAAAPDFFGGENEINPILPEALEQGRVAGCNMAGQSEGYRGWVSWNFLRCFDRYVFNIGRTGPGTKGSCEAVEREEGTGVFRMVFQGPFLIGIECANIASLNAGVFGYLITRRVPVDPYKDLLANKPGQTASWLMLDHRRNQSGKLTTQRGTK